jgi:hypothetical protein
MQAHMDDRTGFGLVAALAITLGVLIAAIAVFGNWATMGWY